MKRIEIVRATGNNPWNNLAIEEFLMERMSAGEGATAGIIYLWQNRDTVVIGRNQNAWAECRAGLLEDEGGFLARRSTGGGAVFHDLGNLNFSLILPKSTFNLDANFSVIANAVAAVGIPTERSGRNDVLADGRKFSGNAFGMRKDVGLHHGTLLVDSDMERVARYLSVPQAKLQAKGVKSVKSRIINLRELRPSLDVDEVATSMETSFAAMMGADEAIRRTDADFAADARYAELCEHYASWDWRYGETIKFDATLEERLDWGLVHVGLSVEGGVVKRAAIYSDALDSAFPPVAASALEGVRFRSPELAAALLGMPGLDEGAELSLPGVTRRHMAETLAALVMAQGW